MDFQSKKINSQFKTIEDYPLKRGYFYIVLFKNILDAKVAPYHFTTERAGQRALEKHFVKSFRKYCRVLSYEEANKFFLVYKVGTGVHHYKYDYSVHEPDKNSQRNTRIRQRRRLRRMGLYTSVRASYNVRKDHKGISVIDTPQKMVIDRKNPQAKAIEIEDDPGVYYLVLERELYKGGTHPEYAFRIRGLKFNGRTCKAKEVTKKIRRNAILIPYLLGELNQVIYETCKKRHQKIPKLWRTFFWKSYCYPIKGRLSERQEAAKEAIQTNLGALGKG